MRVYIIEEVNTIINNLLLIGFGDSKRVEYLKPVDNPIPRISYTVPKFDTTLAWNCIFRTVYNRDIKRTA